MSKKRTTDFINLHVSYRMFYINSICRNLFFEKICVERGLLHLMLQYDVQMDILYRQVSKNRKKTVISRMDRSHTSICRSSRHGDDLGYQNCCFLLFLPKSIMTCVWMQFMTMSTMIQCLVFWWAIYYIEIAINNLTASSNSGQSRFIYSYTSAEGHIVVDLKAWPKIGLIIEDEAELGGHLFPSIGHQERQPVVLPEWGENT